MTARDFETAVLLPTFAEMRAAIAKRGNQVDVHASPAEDDLLAVLNKDVIGLGDVDAVPSAIDVVGTSLHVHTRPSEREGLLHRFGYSMRYQHVDGAECARPVWAFWMAFDARLHVFDGSFRASQRHCPVEAVTREMVMNHFLGVFSLFRMDASAAARPDWL